MAQMQSSPIVQQGFRSVPFVELRQFLPSRVEFISSFVDQLMRFIARFRSLDGSELDIEIALREGLANAIVHGNESDSHKHIRVTCRCSTDGEVTITLEDEGEGFDDAAIPDPTIPDNRLLAHGRGIHLLRTLMDEVHFERCGAVLRMRKGHNVRQSVEGKTT